VPESRQLDALRRSPWLRPVALVASLVAVAVTFEAVAQAGFDTALQAAVLWAVAGFLVFSVARSRAGSGDHPD
jgi:hypothetical protein